MPGRQHEFGGAWTEVKLDVLRKYLLFYTTALKKYSFEKWYIDAFAGSGSRIEARPEVPALTLLDLMGEPAKTLEFPGSARIALETEPPFDRCVFIERQRSRHAALQQLSSEFGTRRINCFLGDANQEIQRLCRDTNWNKWPYIRAVMFLDHYGMTVNWSTLAAIARTEAIDVWYLFPTLAVCRQAALTLRRVDQHKGEALNRVLGTDSWRKAFYAPADATLFGGIVDDHQVREADMRSIEEWASIRLKELFVDVSMPLRLPLEQKPQKFSLFFAVSNPSQAARELAMKVAGQILNTGSGK